MIMKAKWFLLIILVLNVSALIVHGRQTGVFNDRGLFMIGNLLVLIVLIISPRHKRPPVDTKQPPRQPDKIQGSKYKVQDYEY